MAVTVHVSHTHSGRIEVTRSAMPVARTANRLRSTVRLATPLFLIALGACGGSGGSVSSDATVTSPV
jgi:surface polysaccharide O-acyltransferase-like enzyme